MAGFLKLGWSSGGIGVIDIGFEWGSTLGAQWITRALNFRSVVRVSYNSWPPAIMPHSMPGIEIWRKYEMESFSGFGRYLENMGNISELSR